MFAGQVISAVALFASLLRKAKQPSRTAIVGVGSWTTRNRILQICWKEVGGPTVIRPQTRGFGTRLIEEILARDLGGSVRIDFAVTGAQCTIELALQEQSEPKVVEHHG
jgi:two-component sensor histidine kinase